MDKIKKPYIIITCDGEVYMQNGMTLKQARAVVNDEAVYLDELFRMNCRAQIEEENIPRKERDD